MLEGSFQVLGIPAGSQAHDKQHPVLRVWHRCRPLEGGGGRSCPRLGIRCGAASGGGGVTFRRGGSCRAGAAHTSKSRVGAFTDMQCIVELNRILVMDLDMGHGGGGGLGHKTVLTESMPSPIHSSIPDTVYSYEETNSELQHKYLGGISSVEVWFPSGQNA